MNKQPIRIRTALNALAGVTAALGICAAQFARADDGTFTVASLQGHYAYVNNTEGVASFGPMSFDGRGGVTLSETVNLPCANPGQTCDRTIADVIALAPTQLTRMGRGLLRSRSSLLTAPLSAPKNTTS